MNKQLIPKAENEGKGFFYEVSDEQIALHQKRSLEEIFQWLSSCSKFIHALQTQEERERMKKIKCGEF